MPKTTIQINKALFEKSSIVAKRCNRSVSKQVEHWANIGQTMEDNPDLPYAFVKQVMMAKMEKDAGKLEPYQSSSRLN
jgi:hypothetical protein